MRIFSRKNRVIVYISCAVLMLASAGCEKESPTVSTVAITTITSNSAKSGGNVTDEGDSPVTARGVIWGNKNITIETNEGLISSGDGEGLFPVEITGLLPYTEYFVKAFATNKYGTTYGNAQQFKTLPDWAGVVTMDVINISSKGAMLRGEVTDDGGAEITEKGFYYGTLPDPELTGNKVSIEAGTGPFSTFLIDILTPGTNYFVKAYAINLKGRKLGNLISFSTLTSVPELTTTEPFDILTTAAKSGGSIYSTGGLSILEKGIYFGINDNPQNSGNKIVAGTGPEVFTSQMNNLSLGTKYYVIAYSRNSKGTGYGTVKSFVTQTSKPVVLTGTPSDISYEKATLGGNVTSGGGLVVTDRGIYYGTSPDPGTTGTRVPLGAGTGPFSSVLTGLTSGSTYYIVAYAVNTMGESLGSTVSFNTKAKTSPVVLTSSPNDITQDGATTGGNVLSDGGSAVTDRGIYWGTSSNPETSGAKLSVGSGTGLFSVSLSGLATGITYYVKAYATNDIGQGLGSVITFTPSAGSLSGEKIFNPELTYGSISDIEGNSYKTIDIGNQTWMAENLKTALYNDGTNIPYITGNSSWIAVTTPAFCWYDNLIANKEMMGGKYNWWVVESGKICPSGWHVPSDNEWTILTDNLGGLVVAAGKMKEVGITHWNTPNVGATNSSGFTSLPGGSRHETDGTFRGTGSYDCWWSSTAYNEIKAWYRSNNAQNAEIYRSSGAMKITGMGIRCVKD